MKLVAVGRAEEIRGFALAGVTTMVCDAAGDAEAAVAALTAAGSDVGLLIVPPWIGAAARTTIAGVRAARTPPVVLVLPAVMDEGVVGA